MTEDVFIPVVAARVRAAIASASDRPAFCAALERLMERPGRVLERGGAPKWPAFVLETCRLLGGNMEAAVAGAAAVEFAVAAIDVADDLIDDEWDDATIDPRRGINAGMTLAFLAQGCATTLAQHVDPRRAAGVSQLLAAGSVSCCAGQDMDVGLERSGEVTEEQAHEMTLRKSGSLVAMAFRVGAAIATDDPAVVERLGEFGANVGVVAQLLNDIAGVEPTRSGRGSDLRQRKKTLPIAYGLRCAREESIAALAVWASDARTLDDTHETLLAQQLYDVGALHYTWVVADAHRRRALSALPVLARDTATPSLLELRRLVPSVRAVRQKRKAA